MTHKLIKLDLTDDDTRSDVKAVLSRSLATYEAWSSYFKDGSDEVFMSYAKWQLGSLASVLETRGVIDEESGELVGVICWSEAGVKADDSLEPGSPLRIFWDEFNSYLQRKNMDIPEYTPIETSWTHPDAEKKMTKGDEHCSGVKEIQWLGILPSYRGLGLGRRLVDAIGEDKAIVAGTQGDTSKSFYEKLGFEVIENRWVHDHFHVKWSADIVFRSSAG